MDLTIYYDHYFPNLQQSRTALSSVVTIIHLIKSEKLENGMRQPIFSSQSNPLRLHQYTPDKYQYYYLVYPFYLFPNES